MGVLYKLYESVNKKTCTMCGCIMDPKSLNHICECCLDDIEDVDNKDPGPFEDEPEYPAIRYYDD